MSSSWSPAERTAQVWVLKRPFDGFPTAEDFELQQQTLRPVEEGELICEAEYLSVDPYMRIYMERINKFPNPMIGTQVAK